MEFECTDVVVPMNYDDPDGETITLAVRRHNTAGDKGRMLLLNPGGPGGSGTEMVTWASYLFDESVTELYNLVGFDPRGVQTSSAVECISDAELDAQLAMDIPLETDEDFESYADFIREHAAKCQENTGPLLEFVDSESAVRDMDILRAVISRADTLDYFGFSYGTYLGTLYADMFTENVGTFVLDGAMDPSLSMSEIAMGQAMGFDRAIRSYMENCLAGSSCWHRGSAEDGLEKISQLFEVTFSTPLRTDDPDRSLTQSLATSGVTTAMYSVFYWPQLTTALDQAINLGDGTGLLALADTGNSRNPDGTFDGNLQEAFTAINCLDYPIEGTLEDWRADGARMAELYPVFGDSLAYSEVGCSNWPYESARERLPIAAEGSPPILIIGTTGDPATPYEWAVSLSDQLENGHLLTYDGDGHTAYGNSLCVIDVVDDFLLHGTVPAPGETC